MGIDLSAVDAELEQLGRAPEDRERVAQLARSFAGSIGTLAQVDDQLSALAQTSGIAEPLYVTRPQRAPSFRNLVARYTESEAPPRPRSSIPLPPAPAEAHDSLPAHQSFAPAPLQSQPPQALHGDDDLAPIESEWPTEVGAQPRFSMPSESLDAARQFDRPLSVPPAPRREGVPLTQSQEIVLPDPIPTDELSSESGELSLADKRPASGSYSLPEAQPHRAEAASFSRSGANDFANMGDDEVQDALEGSQPLFIGAPAVSKRATRSMERDPDAEFDALLSEATDPRGIPVVGSELDTDDPLRGLEMDDLEVSEAEIGQQSEADQATHEADELARSLYEEAESDNTELLDRAALSAIEAQAPEGDTFRDEFALDAELDLAELEIMLDEEPGAPPQATTGKAPPPPPPGSPDKRPSILGRLFGGKRDGE